MRRFSVSMASNAVLNGAAADQAVHQHVPVLADAVGPVRRLVFHGGVPPAVHMDDVGGLGQSQSGPGRPSGTGCRREARIPSGRR